MAFRRMVSMVRTDDEKAQEHMDNMFPAALNTPDVPPGLCLCLTEKELEKLDLDHDVEVGDMLHAFILARVTSVSKNDHGGGHRIRIEMAITDMNIENEETEGPDDDDEGDEG